MSASAPATQPWSRTDVALALALTAVAWVLRWPGSGLCHFDEGAYATSALAVAQGQFPEAMHPDQQLLSPPLLFLLVGGLMALLGTSSEQVLLHLSSTAGALTAPLLFVLGRACFGRAAGAAAGLLLATSRLHAGFCTMALTDPLFLFWFVLALWLLLLAEERQSLRVAVLAGLATGLAWNTKYHGWLTLTVAAPAALLAAWRSPGGSIRATLARLMAAAVTAALCFLPWFLFVLSLPGGYAAVARQQRMFLGDWDQAGEHITRQWGYVGFLDTWWAGPCLACVVLAWLLPRPRGWLWLAPVLPLFFVAFLQGATTALLALTILALPMALAEGSLRSLLPLAFLAVFSVLTPLYHPFPRLLLPWLAAVCLLAGAALQWCATARLRLPSWRQVLPMVLVAVLIAVSPLYSFAERAGSGGAPLRSVLEAWQQQFRAFRLPVVVLGEPALVFHLRQHGRTAFHINAPAELPADQEVLLITGLYAVRMPSVARWLAENRPWLEPLAEHLWQPSDLRRVDDMRPDALLALRDEPLEPYRFVLYRARVPR